MAESVCESLPRIKEVRAFVKQASGGDQGKKVVTVACPRVVLILSGGGGGRGHPKILLSIYPFYYFTSHSPTVAICICN